MTEDHRNPPAFPPPVPNVSRGMTLRDWFAGQALATCADLEKAKSAAAWAYQVADAMLAERQKP